MDSCQSHFNSIFFMIPYRVNKRNLESVLSLKTAFESFMAPIHLRVRIKWSVEMLLLNLEYLFSVLFFRLMFLYAYHLGSFSRDFDWRMDCFSVLSSIFQFIVDIEYERCKFNALEYGKIQHAHDCAFKCYWIQIVFTRHSILNAPGMSSKQWGSTS